MELGDRLALLNKSSLGRTVFLFSIFIIAVFTAKLALFNAIYNFADWWNTLSIEPLFVEIVAPFSLPPWQLASVLNSAISILLYMRASDGLILLRDPDRNARPLHTIGKLVQTGMAIRPIISLYTISCLLYILASQFPELHWPPIENRIFPWTSISFAF